MPSPLRDRTGLVREAARAVEDAHPRPDRAADPAYPGRHVAPAEAAAIVRLVAAQRNLKLAEHELEEALRECRRVPVSLRRIAAVMGKSHGSLAEWLARRGI